MICAENLLGYTDGLFVTFYEVLITSHIVRRNDVKFIFTSKIDEVLTTSTVVMPIDCSILLRIYKRAQYFFLTQWLLGCDRV